MIPKPRTRPHTRLCCSALLLLATSPTFGQTPTPAKPATKAQVQTPTQKKSIPVSPPAAPQPKHYPILLIASGTEPFWTARIGMKGVERLERVSYPPITLEPAAIEQESTGAAWLYHSKDTATGAELTLRLTRETCSDGMSDNKYSFRAVINHAQIGELKGCAKIAPDQFPEFKQKNLDDDDPEKKKVVPPAITGFKPPVETAYLDATRRLMIAKGEVAKLVAADAYQPSFSHDGKKLLYTQNLPDKERKIVLYDVATAKSTDLLRGPLASPFFSPNDAAIAFMKLVGTDWQVWTMPTNAPDKAARLSPGAVWSLHGWLDAHTVLASDAAKLYFLNTEAPATSIPITEVYREFERNSSDTIRVNPVNPDLLLVSALTQTVRPGMAKDPSTKLGSAIFLYEIKARRQVVISPPTAMAQDGDWSRDGMQIFFTDATNPKASSICRVFWDGSGFKRQRPGTALVVGQ